MLPFLIVSQIIDSHSFIRLFFIIGFIVLLIYEYKFSFYIIKDQNISIPMAQNIDILKIISIHKRKFFFFNKYYFDFKMSQYRGIKMYPIQSDIDAIINDLKKINPDIIIKEYKSYNEHF
jgi:hypothetical protein